MLFRAVIQVVFNDLYNAVVINERLTGPLIMDAQSQEEVHTVAWQV